MSTSICTHNVLYTQLPRIVCTFLTTVVFYDNVYIYILSVYCLCVVYIYMYVPYICTTMSTTLFTIHRRLYMLISESRISYIVYTYMYVAHRYATCQSNTYIAYSGLYLLLKRRRGIVYGRCCSSSRHIWLTTTHIYYPHNIFFASPTHCGRLVDISFFVVGGRHVALNIAQ